MSKQFQRDLKLLVAAISAGTLIFSILRILKETAPTGDKRAS